MSRFLNILGCFKQQSCFTQKKVTKHSLFLFLIILLSSCSMTPAKKEVKFNYDLPEAYGETNGQADKNKNGQARRPVRTTPEASLWWEKFQDETLNSLIKDVLEHNLDLKMALGNINILRAQYQMSKVKKMPIVTASAGANVARTPVAGFSVNRATGQMTKTYDSQINDSYSLQLGAMFEIDIFDKYGSLSRSALNNLKSSQADYYKVYYLIISQTIMAYYDIKMIERTINLNLDINKKYKDELDIEKQKYEAGIGSTFTINSLNQTISSNNAQIESLKKDLKLRKYSLKILLGKYPKDDIFIDDNIDNVIDKLEDLSMGIPSELLKTRFDIVSAHKKLDAAREMIGYKKADRYPSISLSAAIGYMNILDLSNFFDSDFITVSGGANINQTIFSYGSKKAAYEQAVEQYNLALLNYKKVILKAFNEVESILVKIDTLKKQKEELSKSLKFAKASYEEAKRRYLGGVGEYKTLLDLKKLQYNLQINILNIDKGIILSYIDLYRALGKK